MNRRTLQNHYNLAREYGELVRSFYDDEHARAFDLSFASPGLPRFMTVFPFAVSPWPIVISADTKERFAAVVREVPGLLRRALLRFYEDDPRRFCVRYGLPNDAYEYLASRPEEVDRLMVRYDVVLVDNQPRILEANVGSNIGGWQMDWLWPRAADLVRRHPDAHDWRLSYTGMVERFCRFIHGVVHEHVGDDATGMVLVLLNQFVIDRGLSQELAAIHTRVVKETSRPGALRFDTDLTSIAFNESGRITHSGEVVDSIVAGPLQRSSTELSDAHLRHRVFYPDNWLARSLADKTNFAILHSAKAAGWLSARDAHLVDEYIPWSACLTDDVIDWDGDKVPARTLAQARRADLVVKRGISLQGRDVFVGRFLSDMEWSDAIARAGTNGDWLLQAYCPADCLYAPNQQSIVTEHEPVWGVFGFGADYGGAFVRLIDATINRGVINAARGAAEGVVLEV